MLIESGGCAPGSAAFPADSSAPAVLHLFVIHGDGAPPPALDRFSRDFAGDARVCEVDAAPAARARRTIEGMAADLVAAIGRIQPNGPYRLAGWRGGGVLAYEAALQMLGRGNEVGLIAMLGSGTEAPVAEPLDAALKDYHAQIFPLPLRRFALRGGGRWAELPSGAGQDGVAEDMLADAVAPACPPRLPGSRRHACLVELQRAPRAHPSLFCIPGAGASSICFMDFVSAIGDARMVYGLEPRGLDGVDVPHSSVEAAAAAYLKELLPAAPPTGFHLLGHSYGGLVALEMAIMLERMGRAPATVAIVDAPEILDGPPVEHDEAEILRKLLIVYGQRAGRPLAVDGERLAALRGAALREALRAAMAEAGLLPRGVREDMLKGPLNVFARAARSNYRPNAGYRGALRFALVDDPALDADANRQAKLRRIASWRRVATEADFWDGPGDHMSALRPPHVATLADWWSAGVLQ